jgi:hypothetical protein
MRNFLVTMKKFLRKNSLKSKNKKRVMYSVNIALVLCIFALLFIHLSGANELATKGFILKKLYFELGELEATNKDLTLESAEMQSIARIKDVAVENLGMVMADGKDYIVLSRNKDIVKK